MGEPETHVRRRRQSSVFVDAVHDFGEDVGPAPGQLYSTDSGRLFHAGHICIVLVGLPARGKTHLAVGLCRYLRWLGVKTHAFHLGDYRRAEIPNDDIPADYFLPNASSETVMIRQRIMSNCRNDVAAYLLEQGGQVAIFDAVNPTAAGRKALKTWFEEKDVQVIFIESVCTDQALIEENVREVKILSPDYQGWDEKKAIEDYLNRIHSRIPQFETIGESEVTSNYIKLINYGQRLVLNGLHMGYMANRILLYLMNVQRRFGSVFFARAGKAEGGEIRYKIDCNLSEEGREYAKKLCLSLEAHREKEHQDEKAAAGTDLPKRGLVVWTSTRSRMIQTAAGFADKGYPVRERAQLAQMHPGICDGMAYEEVTKQYPKEVEKFIKDPYNFRYPRAESYHDVAVRMEPVILELERTSREDLLIIAHKSVLRVLYGYLMACSATDIPFLEFPRNRIVEIKASAYNNQVSYIDIENVDPDLGD
ncbi:hypothetical protein CANCADRAFT_28237 [Tortispora caseinolytica NRRL Y-17796]|uniref:6-phosphofructo-2-kinase domain-containing protein n=1 Tax=Tortispora caseinolytica NRRL Y-17796 TaxID=767744 RepID=A0A1E4TD09_9ASCO|nr:hypothetical protein CANCADRAFT_28237 [Tortispora caseinolytica NRRL Y-17796]